MEFCEEHSNMIYSLFEVLVGMFYLHNKSTVQVFNYIFSYFITLAYSNGTLTQLVRAATSMVGGIFL